jgi:hypothetical protein
VLGVLQSFPAAEAERLDTLRFFVDTLATQRELAAWASTVVPAQRNINAVQNVIETLSTATADTPIVIPSIIRMLQQVSACLDVYQLCPHLAPMSVPAEAPNQNMDLEG